MKKDILATKTKLGARPRKRRCIYEENEKIISHSYDNGDGYGT